jgi:hypothetical protein
MEPHMSRGAAKFTESDATRIFKAARKAGVDVQVVFRRDGDIVATTGKAAPTRPATEANEWDEVLDGNDHSQTCQ